VSTGALLERLAPAGAADARAARLRAWFVAHGLPTTRAEAWRYTALDDVTAALGRAGPPPPVEPEVTGALVGELAGDHGGPRLVCVNGRVRADVSDLHAVPSGVWLGGRGWEDGDEDPPDGFAALNELAGTDAATVLVGAGVRVDEPLHVVHLVVPGRAVAAVHPRTVVGVGDGSVVEVVETYAGLAGEAITVTNASTRILAGDSSHVTYHRVQVEADDALHVGATRVEQAAGSHVRATSVMTGASVARSAIEARLSGAGAEIDLRGLYLPAGRQRHDNVVTVDHVAPHCRSTQLFKGVVDDHGRGSFTGHVIVRHGAAGTDARQTNRNLVLCPTAQADTRPWLAILADDVRCAHGATVGRLDDEALFYLRSRGIPLPESRALLVAAFVGEVLEGLSPASLRERLTASCAARMSRAGR